MDKILKAHVKDLVSRVLYLNFAFKQSIISILSKHRNLNDFLALDPSGILNPPKLNRRWFIPERFKAIIRKLEIPINYNFLLEYKLRPIFSEKRGVNISPSFLSYPLDQKALEKEQYQELLDSIKYLESILKNDYPIKLDKVRENNEKLFNLVRKEVKLPRLNVSRLSPIADYSGKTRIVAIGDNFSQRVLKPFADYMFDLLSSLKGDCTFSQGQKSREIKSRILNSESSWSFDLTQATDRLPVEVIQVVIEYLFGEKVAHHYLNVLVRSRDFKFSMPNKRTQYLKYGSGQPMGLNSS